ncbi:peptide-methionine (S)-S-oxide reductase MsrA [Aquimarina agarivorans]|uniref:peptide-methionine (S)-S-oxide reductase MsrA n=1 Tax=Aquimarina agarivorans TaxID=980584 RepID=UPI000248E970|nr:peptide-methionine (S)-S-oxide reductase MsrA [Aquimarina agarivorans]
MKSLIVLTLFVLGINACINNPKSPIAKINNEPIQTSRTDGLKNAYFASGCFWCVEAIFESVKGVKEVVSGYSGGITDNPTYKQVGSGNTGHAETVEVQYDPAIIDFETLVKVYYGSQNPTTYGQAPDFGSAYRSIIFFQNDAEMQIAVDYRKKIQESLSDKVRTEILPFEKFYEAEAYHQNYEKLNPNYPYIVRVSKPRLNRFKAKFPELVKNGE